jgi:hypothetical protein
MKQSEIDLSVFYARDIEGDHVRVRYCDTFIGGENSNKVTHIAYRDFVVGKPELPSAHRICSIKTFCAWARRVCTKKETKRARADHRAIIKKERAQLPTLPLTGDIGTLDVLKQIEQIIYNNE